MVNGDSGKSYIMARIENILFDEEKSPEEKLKGLEGYVEELVRCKGHEKFAEGLRRHSWMKDGVTYVGNGTYTMKEALGMAVGAGFYFISILGAVAVYSILTVIKRITPDD